MKTPRAVFVGICNLALFGLAVCLVMERQARAKLGRQSDALRRQLGQMDKLLADNQRLSDFLAQSNPSPSQPNQSLAGLPLAEERASELGRLRGEVAALRQRGQEIETLRSDTRQIRAAQEAAR